MAGLLDYGNTHSATHPVSVSAVIPSHMFDAALWSCIVLIPAQTGKGKICMGIAFNRVS